MNRHSNSTKTATQDEEFYVDTTLAEDCEPMRYGVRKSTYFIAKNAYLSPHQFAPEPNPVFFAKAAGNISGSKRSSTERASCNGLTTWD